jgi:hypothetical protein
VVNGTVIDGDVSRDLVSLIDPKMRLTKGLETSSITVPFTAGKPRNLQHYMDHGESLKSRLHPFIVL